MIFLLGVLKGLKNVNLIASAPTQEEHMAEAEANPLSYKDKLLCDGGTKSFDMDLSFAAFPEYMDEESDIDDDLDDPTPIILFSKVEKRCMHEPWKNVHEDLSKVINGGLWFVGTNYITIRPWEPNFKPEITTFSHAVVWAQLSGLSTEYYDPTSL
ncbi:hypothetical protein SLEP1_g31341 [Rubroshorea leprosula]|uniref:DUF4283 domain-containing protein n=1 Tax=Rubroshorea leprosula TaxID=152421 RepID=A0AAV5KB69_9ROSI|nr:hypothetical protein SLEP1_g31341 [Rubroshorea leprosula]